MSFQSKVLYTGDGVQTQYNVPMPYISTSHIFVYVNEILQLNPMNYTFDGTTVTFSDPPGIDDAIEIKRWTSPTAPLVDFVDGSVLNENDLDTAYLHNYYLSQEYADSFNELVNEALVSVASGLGIVATEPADVIAALVNEMLNTEQAATIQQRVTDIDNNAEAIVTLQENFQAQINTLSQQVAAEVYIQPNEPIPGQGGVPDPIAEGARWYDSDDNNKPYIYQNSAWVSIEDPRIGQAASDIKVLRADVAASHAAIIQEGFARAEENFALASDIRVLGAANADQTAFIVDSSQVTLDTEGGTTLASRFSSLDATDSSLSASITSEQSARIAGDTAIADDVALIGVANGAGTAFILDHNTVYIDSEAGDTFAERFSALSAADSANSASITTINTVTIPGIESNIDQIEAEYGVDIDVNGYVTGFRIINGGTPGASAFVIRSDNFAIVDTTGGGLTEYVPFEISGGKINMRSDVKIDGNLLVTGTINGTALINGTIGSTQIGANAISTSHISANAVTANEIAANAVTSAKINVTDLAAINADLGAITAGTLELDGAGWIKGGQSSYNTGTGYFIGYESAAYKFSLGNPTGNRITWDGSLLTIVGDVKVGEYIKDTTEVVAAANTERTQIGTSRVKKKEFQVDRDGDVRLYYDYKCPNASYTNAQFYTYKNTTSLIDGFSTSTVANYTQRTVDCNTLSEGDTIHIEISGGQWFSDAPEPGTGYIKNAQLRATVTIPGNSTVLMN